MRVEFKALIKQLTIKSLVSGDKEARLLLEFIPEPEMLNTINQLHRADDLIKIVLED